MNTATTQLTAKPARVHAVHAVRTEVAIAAWRLACEGHAHIGTREEMWKHVIAAVQAQPFDPACR
jgi:hypothetical protein